MFLCISKGFRYNYKWERRPLACRQDRHVMCQICQMLCSEATLLCPDFRFDFRSLAGLIATQNLVAWPWLLALWTHLTLCISKGATSWSPSDGRWSQKMQTQDFTGVADRQIDRSMLLDTDQMKHHSRDIHSAGVCCCTIPQSKPLHQIYYNCVDCYIYNNLHSYETIQLGQDTPFRKDKAVQWILPLLVWLTDVLVDYTDRKLLLPWESLLQNKIFYFSWLSYSCPGMKPAKRLDAWGFVQ